MANGCSTDFKRCAVSHANQRYVPLLFIDSSWRWCTRDVRVPCGECSSKIFARTFRRSARDRLVANQVWRTTKIARQITDVPLTSAFSTTSTAHRHKFLKFGQVPFVVGVDPQYALRFDELIKFFVCQRSGQDEPSDRVKKCEGVDC